MTSANSNDCGSVRLCGYCKREVALANFMLHEAHCMRHIALCPQCNEPVPKAQLKEHIAEEHSKVPCAMCGKEFERHDLEDHKVNSCEQRPVTCEYCEIELPVSKMQEHDDACGSRTEKCLTCQSYIMMKHAEEHKLSNCRPPEAEPVWDSEEESTAFGYVDEYDNYDDMLPCEFCDRPYPLEFLIQHQSGCDQNVMQGNAISSPHKPRQVHLPEDDVIEDAYLAPVTKDLNTKPRNKEVENVRRTNTATEMQGNRISINQNRAADHVTNVQSQKAAVEKKMVDMSRNNLDSESAQNGTTTVTENNASSFVSMIPCEFCDFPIELTEIMEHQKVCRWVHPNRAFQEHQSAFDDEYDESPTCYQNNFQKGCVNAYASRGLTDGNTKWASERNGQVATTQNKYPYTMKQSHSELGKESASNQPRSHGRPEHRNYDQDRRQPYANAQPNRYNGRTDHRHSRLQYEEQGHVRPLMDFGSDDVRQNGQREEQRTTRQQRDDNRWSKGQQEQPGKPCERRQVRNDNPRSSAPHEELGIRGSKASRDDESGATQEEPDIPRSKGQKQEQANQRPEGLNDNKEQRRSDRGHHLQPRQPVSIRQRWTQEAEGEEAGLAAAVQPEEENWRRKTSTDGQSQAKFSRGRARPPPQNYGNTGSQKDDEENSTTREPSTRTERGRGGQMRQNLRHVEGQEVRPREGDDRAQTRPRSRGRGHYNGRQARWNRTKDRSEEDYYNAPRPRGSHRDYYE